MFEVTHTSPRRALSHLMRLQAEGETLLGREFIEAIEGGRWEERVFGYLKKIAAVPATFEVVDVKNGMVISPLDMMHEPPLTEEEITFIQKQRVNKALITLAGAIEQFEAQYEL